EEIAELTTARESQARAAEQIRRRFLAEGGDVAAQRGRIEGERDEVQRALVRGEHEMRDLANGLLPFALGPRLIASFHAALLQSGKGGERRSNAEDLRQALSVWQSSKRPSPKRQAAWSAKHWSDLAGFIEVWGLGAN